MQQQFVTNGMQPKIKGNDMIKKTNEEKSEKINKNSKNDM